MNQEWSYETSSGPGDSMGSEIEDFRLGRAAVGQLFGQVIHVLLRNGEVVTADASWASWGFLFGGRGQARSGAP
jgi:hypothetical protein